MPNVRFKSPFAAGMESFGSVRAYFHTAVQKFTCDRIRKYVHALPPTDWRNLPHQARPAKEPSMEYARILVEHQLMQETTST